ncbi:hypothetical protein H845_2395 [Komagataeibacter xylinus E25]|nr:hypothetical protein H845_2395 [Komagataeibacter xylinus E25]
MSKAETVVRNFYDALAQGQAAEALALLDVDVEWTEAKRSPYYAGKVVGPDAIRKTVLEPIGADFTQFAITTEDFVASPRKVAVFGTYTGTFRDGRGELRAPFVHRWTVANDQITQFSQFIDSGDWPKADHC